MNIIVNANAMRSSGTLTIYRQFINHLAEHVGENRYIIFVDSRMPQPEIAGVEYIIRNDHSKLGYITWSFYGLNRWLKRKKIAADLVISLQNVGTLTSTRQIIYYHQAIPLNKRHWSFLKSNERNIAIYKYLYPLIVKKTLSKNTDVVVQIPSIKKLFAKRFNFNGDRIFVEFPDVENIEVNKIKSDIFSKEFVHFIYPATTAPFKEHFTLVKAVKKLSERNPTLTKKIKIHFTFKQEEYPSLMKYIRSNNLVDQFVFDGVLRHDDLLAYYKSSAGLLFPSTIETVGLPLIEAAAFGLPIIVSDLEYAHEVLRDYPGAVYVDTYDYTAWATALEKLCNQKTKYTPLNNMSNGWNDFFELIAKVQSRM